MLSQSALKVSHLCLSFVVIIFRVFLFVIVEGLNVYRRDETPQRVDDG